MSVIRFDTKTVEVGTLNRTPLSSEAELRLKISSGFGLHWFCPFHRYKEADRVRYPIRGQDT